MVQVKESENGVRRASRKGRTSDATGEISKECMKRRKKKRKKALDKNSIAFVDLG